MRKSDKITQAANTLRLLQSMLWYNDKYKIFFSTHHTNNPQQYYCFFLDIKSGQRKHGIYRLTTEAVIVQFLRTEYTVKDLVTMRRYEIVMVQLTNTENELDYHNWLGIPLPLEKGDPYIIADSVQKYL